MESLEWGKVYIKENVRGRDSIFFLVNKNILEEKAALERLTEHGVSKTELEEALFKKTPAIMDELINLKVFHLCLFITYLNKMYQLFDLT